MPRRIADLICLSRDLAHHPREVLLNRGHHQWRGAAAIALIAVLEQLGVPGFYPESVLAALVLAGPSWLLDTAGFLAHGLWATGRIWSGTDCQCCGGGPDDDFDDEEDPDDPDDDGGLARDVETWLHTQTTPTR